MALTRITKGVIKPNENYDTHNIHSTGIVTAIGLDVNGNADISGNMSVGGVLTYEDVTSIDSVGIITAQKDIHVGAGLSVVGVSTFNDDVTFTGANYNVLWDKSHSRLDFDADAMLRFQGNSFRIYNDGSGTSFIRNQSINLRITSDIFRVRKNNDSTHYINCEQNRVQLYQGGDEKLRTISKGIRVGTGVTIETNGQAEVAGITTFYKDVHIKSAANRLYLGTNDRLSLIADPSHSYLRINGGHFQIHNNNFSVRSYDGNGSIIMFYSPINDGSGGGGPRLYHYHGAGHTYERLRTTKSGVNIVGTTTTTQLAVTGVTTFQDDVTFDSENGNDIRFDRSDNSFRFGDSCAVRFGGGNDLKIQHHQNNSYIDDNGAGALRIRSSELIMGKTNSDEKFIRGVQDAQVELFYNNSKKLNTTSTGVDISGILNVSGVVGISSNLNVTGITSISGGYAPQPFTVSGGSHPTPGYHHRQQFVFRTNHGHTDLKFENNYGGNWYGGSVSHTRILWEAYNERNSGVPGGDYGKLGEFCSIQPKNNTGGAFTYLDFKGNDGVAGLSTMCRMYANQLDFLVHGNTTARVDQVGLGITGNIYHINDWNTGYSNYDTYFGFPGNDQFHLYTYDTRKLLITSNKLTLENLSAGVEIQSDVSITEYIKHYGDTNTYFGFPSNDQFDVFTNGARRLNINSGGTFNFNHTSVGSSYNFNGPSSDNNWGGYLKLHSNNGSTVQAEIRTSTSGMMFGYGGSERLRINSSGHVVPGADSSYDLGLTGTRFRSAYVDTYYGDGSNLTGVQGVPTGCILLWSGAANAIPSGFVLCNGSNSTPDLRGKFVVGYHDGNGDYDVGDTGGAETVTLSEAQIPSHDHTFSSSHTHGSGSYSTNTTGSHNHTWQRQDVGINNGYRPWPASNNDCKSTTVNTGSNGNHSHTITGTSGSGTASGTTGNAGSGNAHENRPPYYALCYIMKT